jgi:hypothetical protein
MAIDPAILKAAGGASGSSGGAGLGAMVAGVSSIGNALLQYRANNKNIRFQREANQKARENAIMQAITERKWAVKDWNRQNAYNHPLQQMQRLKEAGLNPNLVYGSGVETTAGPVPNTNVSTPEVRAPHMEAVQIDAMNPLLAYYDLQARGLQNDNLQYNSEILQANADFIRTKTAVEAQNLRDKELAYGIHTKSADAIIQERYLKNQMLEQQIESQEFYRYLAVQKFDLDKLEYELDKERVAMQKAKNPRELENIFWDTLQKQVSVNKSNQEIEYIKQQIANLKASGALTDVKKQLAELGLTFGTPEYISRFRKETTATIGSFMDFMLTGQQVRNRYRTPGNRPPRWPRIKPR